MTTPFPVPRPRCYEVVLRTLISHTVRDVCEGAFTELAWHRDRRVNLGALHRRLLADVLAIGTSYPLVRGHRRPRRPGSRLGRAAQPKP